jgi:hypothetical protein
MEAAGGRAGFAGSGLLEALRTSPERGIIVAGVAFALVLCVSAWLLARHDPLTWIATAYLMFSTTMAPVVWGTNAGFTRVLVPLYGFGIIAVAGGIAARRARERAAAARSTASPFSGAPTAPTHAR